jgi:hypothetical protein
VRPSPSLSMPSSARASSMASRSTSPNLSPARESSSGASSAVLGAGLFSRCRSSRVAAASLERHREEGNRPFLLRG